MITKGGTYKRKAINEAFNPEKKSGSFIPIEDGYLVFIHPTRDLVWEGIDAVWIKMILKKERVDTSKTTYHVFLGIIDKNSW